MGDIVDGRRGCLHIDSGRQRPQIHSPPGNLFLHVQSKSEVIRLEHMYHFLIQIAKYGLACATPKLLRYARQRSRFGFQYHH